MTPWLIGPTLVLVWMLLQAAALLFFILRHVRPQRRLNALDPQLVAARLPQALRIWTLLGSPSQPSFHTLAAILVQLDAHDSVDEPMFRRISRVHPAEVFAAWRSGGAAALSCLWASALHESPESQNLLG